MSAHNRISLLDHKPISQTLELDACLTGSVGRCDHFVYHMV